MLITTSMCFWGQYSDFSGGSSREKALISHPGGFHHPALAKEMPMIPDSPFIAFAYQTNNITLVWKKQAFFIKTQQIWRCKYEEGVLQ